MPCPVCGNDVWADAPHVCPEGFVAPARAVLTFYAYNALNQCCRSWMLLGWRDDGGRPKLADDERGRMSFDCPQCGGKLWIDIAHPDATIIWDEAKQGPPQPPALVAGRIRAA
jgi:rRNA maturation protein Nop10